MAASRSHVSRTRLRLASRLGWRALGGLSLLGLVAVGFFGTAVWLVHETWVSMLDGNVIDALFAVATFMVTIAMGAVSAGWLCAPTASPDGVCLPREAAEPLYRLVERMSRRFGNARIDAIWIVGDMNAAILQRPRWGLFGPMETHLMIGLPLAHSVSRRQFSAILAHEFAHLVLQRRGLQAWWGHLRAWWFRALDRCVEDATWLGEVLERWSAKDLRDAMRLSRLEEFEADALAGQVVGARLVGEALVEVALKERFLSEDYWRKVMEQSHFEPRPVIRPFREMGLGVMAGFRRPIPGSVDIRYVYGQRASASDFHPTLNERLRALRVMPEVPRAGANTLANACLGPLLPTLAWIFDRAWWEDSRRDWRQRYQRARCA